MKLRHITAVFFLSLMTAVITAPLFQLLSSHSCTVSNIELTALEQLENEEGERRSGKESRDENLTDDYCPCISEIYNSPFAMPGRLKYSSSLYLSIQHTIILAPPPENLA